MKLKPLAAAATLALSSLGAIAPAHAALTLTGVACNGQGTGMTSLAGYVDCSGAWSGNNRNQNPDLVSFVLSDWGLNVLSRVDITGGNSTNAGTLNLLANQTGLFVIALKAGNAFSLYEFNGAAVSGGISTIAFDTRGVGFTSNGGNTQFGQGLSHADLYSVTAVPEPDTYALILAGIAGVGVVVRRRRQS